MLFEVRPNAGRKRKILFVQFTCVAAVLIILWLLNCDFMAETFQKDPFAYRLFVGLMGMFGLLMLLSFYTLFRPRVCVREDGVTFCRMFRPAKEVAWHEITARKAEADPSYGQARATVMQMLGGSVPYYIYRKAHGLDESETLQAYPRRYTYYQGKKKLIVILEREMENAARFDEMVCRCLEQGSLETAAESALFETEQSGAEKTGKREALAALAVAMAALFILAGGVIVMLPRLHRSDSSAQEKTSAEQENIPFTYEGVTFEANAAWSEIEGYDGSFVDDATGVIYQLNGVSRLAPYSAEEFYTELLDYYKESHDPVIGGKLEQSTAPDGEERYMANIRMIQDDVYYQYFTVVIFPWKDTVVTFGAQTVADGAARHEEEIMQTVEGMAQSAVYSGEAKAVLSFDLSEDYFVGTSWTAGSDGSEWTFDEDGTFHWYQDGNVTDDNYYTGTYTFYTGEEAKDYLTEYLADFGITEEELARTINARPEYGQDNLVCLTAHNESFLVEGKEQLSAPTETHYCGFLLEDGEHLSLLNMQTAAQYEFSKKE